MSAYRNFIQRLESEIGLSKPPKAPNSPNVLQAPSAIHDLGTLGGFDERDAAKLAHDAPPWDVEDWRSFHAERVSITEFDGRVPHTIAEVRAYQACILEWLNQNPPPITSPSQCAECRRPEMPGAEIVPFGTGAHVWLHAACWRPWQARRLGHAKAALKVVGINAVSNGE